MRSMLTTFFDAVRALNKHGIPTEWIVKIFLRRERSMDGEFAFVDEGVEGRVGVSLGVEAHGFEDLA